MWSPHEHAAQIGITVRYAAIVERGRYYPHPGLIVVQPGLHPVVERCTVAHELGHHYRGASERRADQWAADFLISAEHVAACAIEAPENPELWADRLMVIPRYLRTWLSDERNVARAEQLWKEHYG